LTLRAVAGSLEREDIFVWRSGKAKQGPSGPMHPNPLKRVALHVHREYLSVKKL
jgi:hypothetical protein